MVMLSNDEHQTNAQSPIEVTLSGRVMLDKEVQSLNALSPIEATPSGIVMFSNDSQTQNASSPIEVTSPSKVITPLPFSYTLLTMFAPKTYVL